LRENRQGPAGEQPQTDPAIEDEHEEGAIEDEFVPQGPHRVGQGLEPAWGEEKRGQHLRSTDRPTGDGVKRDGAEYHQPQHRKQANAPLGDEIPGRSGPPDIATMDMANDEARQHEEEIDAVDRGAQRGKHRHSGVGRGAAIHVEQDDGESSQTPRRFDAIQSHSRRSLLFTSRPA